MACRFLPVPREQRLNSRSFENETAVTFVTMSNLPDRHDHLLVRHGPLAAQG
jgi:hypothetical protein